MIPCSNEYLDVDEYHDTGRNIKTWIITMIIMMPCSNEYLDVDEYHDTGRNMKTWMITNLIMMIWYLAALNILM